MTPYSGRLIFDHLPKTAGQAVNAWLRSTLGDRCVTENLVGQHRELIGVYGGAFNVISAHVQFSPCEGIDPRYQYITLLRNPVDRVISWIFFVIKNHEESQLQNLFQQCTRFIESEGDILGDELKPAISNLYVSHFSRILGSGRESGPALLANALNALEFYDVVGLYEDLSIFTNNVGALIGIPAPNQLDQVNVTQSRPAMHQISSKLRARIGDLNKLDLEFYESAQKIVRFRENRKAPDRSSWGRLLLPEPRIYTSNSVTIRNAKILHTPYIRTGDVITFDLDVEFHRDIALVEAGIHILDDQKRWAFGVNNTLVGTRYSNIRPGRHRIRHHIAARLPAGRFTAGFAFADVASEQPLEIYWHDGLLSFTVENAGNEPGVGYALCPARQSLWAISGEPLTA